MRHHADDLRQHDIDLTYLHPHEHHADETYEDALSAQLHQYSTERLIRFEIEDRFFARRLERFAHEHQLPYTTVPSPMLLTSRARLADDFTATKKPFMAMGDFLG